jgi:hypothetical protein
MQLVQLFDLPTVRGTNTPYTNKADSELQTHICLGLSPLSIIGLGLQRVHYRSASSVISSVYPESSQGSCFGTPPSPKLKRFSLINGIKFVSPRSPYPALYVFPIVFWQQSPHTSQVSRTTRMAACRRTVLGVRRHLPGLQRPDVYKGVLCHSAVGFRPDIWTTQLADV